MRRSESLLCVVLMLAAPALYAQILDEDTLALGTEVAGAWFEFERRSAIDAVIDAETDLSRLLEEARQRIDAALADEGEDCRAPPGGSGQRACVFTANLSAYEEFLADQACRASVALNLVTEPSDSANAVMEAVTAKLGESNLAGLDLFAVERRGSTLLVFEETHGPADCVGSGDLRLVRIIIPEASETVTDKLVLAYTYALSLTTFEYNRPNVEVTAKLIRQANERWSQFETNVIHDQYPWETLLFNDWLAGAWSRFRGTLTHPPTQQIRALHPVPTAILDVSGGDTLFRPRLTVEVLGLRYLNETDYTPKRAVSIIATLKADAGESNGWGLLYTWKRGSVGLVHQKKAIGDNVIGLVFGIDLANQIQSRRNNVMEEWRTLRTRLEELGRELP